MIRRIALALVLLATVAPAAPQNETGRKDGERLRHLIAAPIERVESVAGLTAQPTARLISRTGIPNAVLPTIRRYRVLTEGESRPHDVTFLDVKYRGRAYRLGVAVTPQTSVLGPLLFDDFGKPVSDLDLFLSQFKGEAAVRLTEASSAPIGAAIETRDEVLGQDEPPARKADRERWVLLRHYLLMREAADRHQVLLETLARDEPLRKPFGDLLDRSDEMHQFASHLKAVLEPKEVGEYRRLTNDLRTELGKAREPVEGGDRDAVQKIVDNGVKLACNRCHAWKNHHWNRPLAEGMRAAREQAGFKHGYFVVDMDVRRADLDAESAQEIAGCVKAALLLARGVE